MSYSDEVHERKRKEKNILYKDKHKNT